jgi:hypothetical protein
MFMDQNTLPVNLPGARIWNSLSPKRNAIGISINVHVLPTTDGMHYLDLITDLEKVVTVSTAWHDLTIHFQCDAFIGELELLDQVPGSECLRYLSQFTIHEDLHVGNLAIDRQFYRRRAAGAGRLTGRGRPLEWGGLRV